MSAMLTADKATLTKGEGKMKKLFASIKKLFAKEFLWMLFILLLGLPLALIASYLTETYASAKILTEIDKLLGEYSLFDGFYLLSLVGIYFTRVVVGAIKTMINKPKS